MKLPIKDIRGNEKGELETAFAIIENGKGSQALHDTIVAFQAARRSGTASTKTMGEVAGTGKKPWRQKGTGRARAGSFASPLWRGGGVVFGPKPRDFAKKVSKNTRQLALRKALSERLKAGDVLIVEDLQLEAPKTKEFISALSNLGIESSAILVLPEPDQNLARASRNVSRVQLKTSDTINAYDLLLGSKLMFTKSAFERLEQRLK